MASITRKHTIYFSILLSLCEHELAFSTHVLQHSAKECKYIFSDFPVRYMSRSFHFPPRGPPLPHRADPSQDDSTPLLYHPHLRRQHVDPPRNESSMNNTYCRDRHRGARSMHAYERKANHPEAPESVPPVAARSSSTTIPCRLMSRAIKIAVVFGRDDVSPHKRLRYFMSSNDARKPCAAPS